MASPAWIGQCAATYDVWTFTPGGTIEVGDIFNVICNGKTLAVVAAGTTVASVVASIVAAWNALSDALYPEFREYTAVNSTTTVTCTANTAGIPGTFTVTTTETGGGAADAQTFVASNATPATGPNFWSNAKNWDTGIVPVDTDTPVIADSDVPILYGLDQSAGPLILASLTILSTYTGAIGLPRRNSRGYQEYRTQYLSCTITALNVGQGSGAGSGRIKINTGSAQTTVNVFGTGRTKESGVESFIWKGTHASNALNVTQGSVGVAIFPAETATLSGGLKVGFETSQASDAQVRCGSGLTLSGTITQTGGTVELNSAYTTLNKTGGTFTHRGSGAVTTVNNREGTYYDESTGTYTLVEQQGTYDRRRVLAAKTITTMRVYKGSKTYTPYGPVTYTNAVEFFGCENGDDAGTYFSFGVHRKFTVADI